MSAQSQENQSVTLTTQERRERVYALIDGLAEVAVSEIAETLQYRPVDALDLATKKLHLDAANDILDYAGYNIQRVQLAGTVKFEPLQISHEAESHTDAAAGVSLLKD